MGLTPSWVPCLDIVPDLFIDTVSHKYSPQSSAPRCIANGSRSNSVIDITDISDAVQMRHRPSVFVQSSRAWKLQ